MVGMTEFENVRPAISNSKLISNQTSLLWEGIDFPRRRRFSIEGGLNSSTK